MYFVAGTNDLYGIKVSADGKLKDEKKVRLYETGYSATTPEVYNGKVYVSVTLSFVVSIIVKVPAVSEITMYFVAGTNDLYGIKVSADGKLKDEKKVRLYETGYSATTPEVYNGKVYVSGSKGKAFQDKGYMAVA